LQQQKKMSTHLLREQLVALHRHERLEGDVRSTRVDRNRGIEKKKSAKRRKRELQRKSREARRDAFAERRDLAGDMLREARRAQAARKRRRDTRAAKLTDEERSALRYKETSKVLVQHLNDDVDTDFTAENVRLLLAAEQVAQKSSRKEYASLARKQLEARQQPNVSVDRRDDDDSDDDAAFIERMYAYQKRTKADGGIADDSDSDFDY
jgi:hypothetical protein